ncbi:MAG: alanine racemase [Longimicrobiales bacterium]|nr:alanine racemase [Longimicrobiales bacterium]
MSTDPRTRAWIEVQSASLRRNYQRLRDAVPAGVRLVPMVKADAYGLGMLPAVRALSSMKPWGWGVATVDEGVALRAAGIQDPVLLVAPVPPGCEPLVVAHRLTASVSATDTLDRLHETAGDAPVPVHVEVDTGMGRAGFPWDRVREWGPALRTRLVPPLRWEGLSTHLHSADELGGPGVEEQIRRFRHVAGTLNPPAAVLLHVANSAGILRLGSRLRGFGLARPGIFLYGGSCGPDLPAPDPVVSVRARVVRVEDVSEGATAGYGATYRASGPERWATLALGYGDGYRRAASHRGQVLVRGRRAPLIGRVSMDLTVANITGHPGVVPGDVATFLGSDGDGRIGVDEVAAWMGTIPYEVFTGFTPRLPRLWLDENR